MMFLYTHDHDKGSNVCLSPIHPGDADFTEDLEIVFVRNATAQEARECKAKTATILAYGEVNFEVLS